VKIDHAGSRINNAVEALSRSSVIAMDSSSIPKSLRGVEPETLIDSIWRLVTTES